MFQRLRWRRQSLSGRGSVLQVPVFPGAICHGPGGAVIWRVTGHPTPATVHDPSPSDPRRTIDTKLFAF